MTVIRDDLIKLLRETPGLSDRKLTDRLCGRNQPQQPINVICRRLAEKKRAIVRGARADGIIGNYLADESRPRRQI